MKRQIILFIFAFFAIISSLSAQMTVSGILDSTVSMQAGAGDAPDFSSGFEEYANIRFQSKIRDRAAVFGAVNLIAATGNYAANSAVLAGVGTGSPFNSTSYIYGENYIAGIELERLYFRLSGKSVNFDGGLMRLPFGYGQVFGPSDFLNPRNPLKPDARPRAILGTAFFWYPTEETKLLIFYSAPRDPFMQKGDGSFFGLSFDKHWNKASIQTLYCFETPNTNSDYGIHRAGLSVKADIEIGLYIDALYTYNYEAETKLDGLSFSAGADYSFFDGNLIILAEYLYNGENSSTAPGNGGSFSYNNYLYTSLTFRFNDYTNLSAALISGLDDISFTPIITLNHDLFQGSALIITAQAPLDRDLFYGDGRRGELGPVPPDELQPLLPMRMGRYFDFSAKIRLRF
ncbi:MAG: hypothetical protein LBV17_09770 [Treponema sp.]|jgi:hypothetical protein|nr:hypothetical protein [Treponema sp.]